MSLVIHTFTLGPLDNNTYLLEDTSIKECIVIDPTYEMENVLDIIQKNHLKLKSLWITHAHFDHIIGVSPLWEKVNPHPLICLHRSELDSWLSDGGAREFNLHFSLPMQPDCFISDKQELSIGKYKLEVRHAPGHSPGHVIFYSPDLNTIFSGDLIFYHSIGRTDLPGGDQSILMESIHNQVLIFPDDTRILSGHGLETSVGEERRHNPFLK
jgi:glyoxylase-like metal-dependent hydrolase (beta-lactamase superfamily II)